MHGGSFAVDSLRQDGDTRAAWYAFDGKTDTYHTANVPDWILLYNPYPLNITSITLVQNYYLLTGSLEYSHDGITFVHIMSITSNSRDLTITPDTTGVYAKYWRLNCYTVSSNNNWGLWEFRLSGTYAIGRNTYPDCISTKMIIKY